VSSLPLACWDSITRIEYDHKHAGERIRFYDYMDAATLLADFWTEVETLMKERSESDD
jgi:hypothetical protein